MDDHLHDSGAEDILEAVLTNAFSPPPSRRQSAQPGAEDIGSARSEESANTSESHEAVVTPAEPLQESSVSSSSDDDSWKSEYESQVEAWRAQSSEAREKAEKERERWESIRATEHAEAARRKAAGIVDEPVAETREPQDAGWEKVSSNKSHPLSESTTISGRHSPTPVNANDLVASESQVTINDETSPGLPRTHSNQDTGDESQKWEDIHSSVTSSFPSMTYPERTETPSPLQERPAPPQPAPLSATLTIFDSTLSTRTRVVALLSSLAINLALPFVNGVMLGFGEIFAKNVVMGWLGWKGAVPGSIATNTGIGIKTPWGQKQKQS
ncbi:hypothetical protein BDZ94DRAFT_1318229 [Collybia nuda]|uniref:Uncharacterized protein n=1 Tax=Collybia nuda TaxID=64659 RepID=A0A9P5YF63_9AGAR|nr:hypothetical protein BDZ94DRAFT_1318229 [Collybia nuda]